MNWTKLEIKLNKPELEEIANTVLLNNGAQGIELDDTNGTNVITYFEDENIDLGLLETIKNDILKYNDYGFNIKSSDFEVNSSLINDSWKYEWQKYYHPTRISRYLIVAPEWEKDIPVRPDENLVIMNPGESFGTGTHATTFTCLQALEMIITNQKSMFDVGTGSGILSIAARKMGVTNIEAFDIDPVSIEATRYNFSLNEDSSDIVAKENSLLDGISKKADIIVANILAEILKDFIPNMEQNLNDDGTIILSGIINEVEADIIDRLAKEKFVVVSIIRKDGWSTIITKRQKDVENADATVFH